MVLSRVVAGVVLCGVLGFVSAACSSGSMPSASNRRASGTSVSAPTTTESTSKVPIAVASTTRTFVDRSRSTAANGSAPAHNTRTLVTTIWYPSVAKGSEEPETAGGPWPLVVFSHGYAANPDVYADLLRAIASAGYVVAAPAFPLSSSGAAGGPTTGDVAHQPGDVAFVIRQLLAASKADDGVVGHLIDPGRVAAVGHSLGAITTLATVANTCCRVDAVKAAVILAGTNQPMPGGTYRLASAPPMLVVSGTKDSLIPYNQAAKVFNGAVGPKAMVTLVGGNHMDAAAVGGLFGSTVADAVVGFLDAVLSGHPAKIVSLKQLASATVQVSVTPGDGEHSSVSTLPEGPKDLHATADRTTGLRGGDLLTVDWTGFSPGKQVSILQCGPKDRDFAHADACDFKNAKLLQANPTGSGSVTLTITEGAVGTSTCDARHSGCFILLNNGASTDPSDMFLIPIAFAD